MSSLNGFLLAHISFSTGSKKSKMRRPDKLSNDRHLLKKVDKTLELYKASSVAPVSLLKYKQVNLRATTSTERFFAAP